MFPSWPYLDALSIPAPPQHPSLPFWRPDVISRRVLRPNPRNVDSKLCPQRFVGTDQDIEFFADVLGTDTPNSSEAGTAEKKDEKPTIKPSFKILDMTSECDGMGFAIIGEQIPPGSRFFDKKKE